MNLKRTWGAIVDKYGNQGQGIDLRDFTGRSRVRSKGRSPSPLSMSRATDIQKPSIDYKIIQQVKMWATKPET